MAQQRIQPSIPGSTSHPAERMIISQQLFRSPWHANPWPAVRLTYLKSFLQFSPSRPMTTPFCPEVALLVPLPRRPRKGEKGYEARPLTVLPHTPQLSDLIFNSELS